MALCLNCKHDVKCHDKIEKKHFFGGRRVYYKCRAIVDSRTAFDVSRYECTCECNLVPVSEET